jgi:hypothetical protein
MRRSITTLLLTLSAAVFVAAQTPAQPQYDAKWELDSGQVYTGTVAMAVDAKGVVSGKMHLTVPATVTGTLSGAVKDGVWTFKFPYTVIDQGCSGTVAGTGKIPADRKVITGTATIEGCSETPLSSTFTLTRQEKK